jgi:hypothetical protein
MREMEEKNVVKNCPLCMINFKYCIKMRRMNKHYIHTSPYGGCYGPSVAKLDANPGIEVRSQVREATFLPRVASIIFNCSKITLIKYNSCAIRLFARVIKN